MASPLFFGNLRSQLGFEFLLDIHLAQPDVLSLQLFYPYHQRYVHPAKFGSPLVERRRVDVQFSTQCRHRKAGLDALDSLNDRAVRKSRLLHAVELLNEKILLLTTVTFRGDYRISTDTHDAGAGLGQAGYRDRGNPPPNHGKTPTVPQLGRKAGLKLQ